MTDSTKPQSYTYSWYIDQFEKAADRDTEFGQSIDEELFVLRPAEDVWSVAECYSHLIKFGELYLGNMEPNLSANYVTNDNLQQPFEPRWIVRKVISFFEPPYKIKIKTLKPMEPATTSDYNRMDLIEEYSTLQNRFITELEKGRRQHTDLGAVMAEHPVFSFLTMTLSECFAIIEVHQRRHMWQAEQILKRLAGTS